MLRRLIGEVGRGVWAAAVLACLLGAAAGEAAAELKIVDVTTELHDAEDLAQAEAKEVMRLVGPRGGFASGVVVASGAEASDGLRAEAGALIGPGGRIEPAALRVRYAAKLADVRQIKTRGSAGDRFGAGEMFTNFPYYDVLHETPREGAALAPIWLTVEIPADATPGVYEGELTVGSRRVPVRLEVGRWRCPPPRQWVTHAGLIHSPETLARRYETAMYSPRHWELIEQSLRFMGALGNDDLQVTVLSKNVYGQDHAMVRFRKEDGGYRPDFSILDRYLDAYERHVGPPQYVLVNLWTPSVASRRHRSKGWEISVIQPDGTCEIERVDPAGEPGSAAIWQPVMNGVRQRVRQRGWDEAEIIIAMASDQRPTPQTIDFFKRIAPYARWGIWTHGRGDPPPPSDDEATWMLSGMEIGFYMHPYCSSLKYPVEDGVQGGWDMAHPQYTNPRKYIFPFSPLTQYRQFVDGLVVNTGGRPAAGYGQIGLDFWEIENGRELLMKYKGSWWDNFYRQCPTSIVGAGADGPVGTARFEMLREGTQEAEARIVIEKALASGALSDELEARCRSLLKRRIDARQKHGEFSPSHAPQEPEARLWGLADDWQDLTRQLYDLAGEVAPHAEAR